MPRKKGGVEIAVAVGLLAVVAAGAAGCANGPEPVGAPATLNLEAEGFTLDHARAQGEGTPPPDGLDYIRAVQCGGLLWARYSSPEGGGPGLLSMVHLYRRWAELRAGQAGQDATLALRDMVASREDFIAEAKLNSNRKVELEGFYYTGDVKSCAVAAEAADYDIVVIGG